MLHGVLRPRAQMIYGSTSITYKVMKRREVRSVLQSSGYKIGMKNPNPVEYSNQASNRPLLFVGSGDLSVLWTRKMETTFCSVGTTAADESREDEEAEEKEECDDACSDRLDIGGRLSEDTEGTIVGVASIFPVPVVTNGVVLSPIDKLSQRDIGVVPKGMERLEA